MKIILSGILFLVSSQAAIAQKARIVKLDQLQEIIQGKSPDSQNIEVINFWATWCAPCVKELPFFEKLNASSKPGVHVTLVSMDLDLDPNPDKVYKFINKRNIQSSVLLLDEKDPNSWIDKIEKQWSGALPATLVVNHKTGKRKFVEKELHEGDLEKLIDEVQ